MTTETAVSRLGFEVVSALAAAPDTVWRHAVSPAGVNHELGPFLRMSFPVGTTDLGDALGSAGRPRFRSHIRLFGLVPVEWDDVGIAAFEPGRRFLERSTLLTQRVWEHERVVTTDGDGCRVTDRLRFVPRVGALGPLHWAAFRTVFTWRHRRLRRRFGARPLTFRLETPRLLVRPWRAVDRAALRRLATDPDVVRWLGDGSAWTDAEIDALLERQRRLLQTRGFCLGAVVERTSGDVIGLGGLQPLGTTDDVEIGWWLTPSRWGQGLATEMGRAAIEFAFDVAGVQRVVAITRPENVRSIAVMDRLGLRHVGQAEGAELGLRIPDVTVLCFAADRLSSTGVPAL
jgi:RimJ/RimL family protein N-acetyltransferase/ligand-binding SRPBCC domain-containing protein